MEIEETNIKDKEIFYIFLDVDGVLNNEEYIEECWEKNGHYAMHMNHVPFDPKCLNNLMLLVQHLRLNYEVKIILSSTWRLHEVDYEIVDARIAEYGMTITDKTPVIHMDRGLEIQQYLQEHECKDYLVIDDEVRDIENVVDTSKIIHTNFKDGLTEKLVYQFIDLYNMMEVVNDNRKT